MALKQFKPTTSSQRGLVLIDRQELWKGRPEKTLSKGLKKTGGRNNHGRITTRHIGGRHKRLYRLIDFKRIKFDIEAVVARIEYDPNRTAFIALIEYTDGEKAYIIAPQRLNVGDKVISGEKCDIKPGNAMPLYNIPVGTIVHNVELKPKAGAKIARSAGCYVQIVGKDNDYVLLRLRSGELRKVRAECMATIGAISNADHQNENYAKAGRMRWKGVRPTVRGVAMNPVDHPHGGGEGKTSGGRHPCSPWGMLTKGKRTRNNKSTDKFIVKRRYQK
jgi:large subunit ribosomal protein L2